MSWSDSDEVNTTNLNAKLVQKDGGNETIIGIKTFDSIPVLPASDPTTDNQAVRKSYADEGIRGDETLKLKLFSLIVFIKNDGGTHKYKLYENSNTLDERCLGDFSLTEQAAYVAMDAQMVRDAAGTYALQMPSLTNIFCVTQWWTTDSTIHQVKAVGDASADEILFYFGEADGTLADMADGTETEVWVLGFYN